MVKEGPFQRIVDVYFPDEGGGGGTSNITISVIVYFGIWWPGYIYGWMPIFSDTINGQGGDRSNVVSVINGLEGIQAPPVEETGPFYDAEEDRLYYRVHEITGKWPQFPPGSAFILWTNPDPRSTGSGSTLTAPAWDVTYRNYYSIFGIHHQKIETVSEFTKTWSCSGLSFRSTDGYLYTGGTFETTPYPNLIITEQL